MEHGWLDGAGRAAGVGEGRLNDVHEYIIQNTRSKVKQQVCPPLSTVVLVLHILGNRRDSRGAARRLHCTYYAATRKVCYYEPVLNARGNSFVAAGHDKRYTGIPAISGRKAANARIPGSASADAQPHPGKVY